MARKTRLSFGLAGLAITICAGIAAGWYWYRLNGHGPDNLCPSAASHPVMDAEQRGYIWEIENHVDIVREVWFHHLADQLSRSDASSVKLNFAKDFKGQLLARPKEERLQTPFCLVVREKDSGAAARSVSGDEMASYLLDWRKKFSSPPQVKVFAKSMAPANPSDLDSAWGGLGVIRMWGEATPGKPAEVMVRLRFEMSRPVKQTQPGWLRRCQIVQAQFAQAEKYLLRDVTLARNVDASKLHDHWDKVEKISQPGGVYLCDFNRDGILDMLVTDPFRYFLYQGLPDGKFRDVTADMGLPESLLGYHEFNYAAFADLDGDGWEDLLLGGKIYRNDNGRRFVDWTYKTRFVDGTSKTKKSLSPVGAMTVVDFDRDGRVDLFITVAGKGKARSWLDGHSGIPGGNQLWRNLGNWQFEEVSAKSNTLGGSRSVFSAVWFDANDDGWPDVYVPNEFGNGILLVNQRDGTFREQAIMSGPQDFGTMGLTCGDMNNDGKIDLYLGNMYSKTGMRIMGNVRPGTYPEDIMAKIRRFVTGSQLYVNQGDLKFKPVAEEWQMNDVGWAYGPAMFDLDNDGFLDIFATSGFMSFDRSKPDG